MKFFLLPLIYIQLAMCQELEAEALMTDGMDELPPPGRALTPDETCEYCQLTLRSVHGHFGGKVVNKRKLSHQLKHQCNRHSAYRRRCLIFVKDNTDLIFSEMSGGDFKPIKPCFVIKECKRLQSPITDDFSIAPTAVDTTLEPLITLQPEQVAAGQTDEKSDPDAGEFAAEPTGTAESEESEKDTTTGVDTSDDH